ncbi:MAG: response regulator [Magnetospirillum sp. WYHS-4]
MGDYDLSGLKVLLVEKHAYMRRIIHDILKTFGITAVREASSHDAAYAMFKDQPPDLVLTDWSPGLDGLRLVRLIRTDLVSPDPYVPIIVVTANTEIRHVIAARDAGMTEYLAKPITAKFLYARIRSIIERQRVFIRSQEFFGPDRRRRRADHGGPERRSHRNVAGMERRQRELPHPGSERRQGYPGYRPPDWREDGRGQSPARDW